MNSLMARRCARVGWSVAVAGVAAALLGAAAPAKKKPDFAEGVRSSDALTPEQERAAFVLPEGFKVALVAAEPQVNKPINIAVDARGRVWVASTVEYPWQAKAGAKTRDAIKVLEDADGDGTYEKVTTFADNLNIPAGIYPYKDGCIAFSIPDVLLLRDTDGDGVADKREVLYGPFDTTRDTHGMTNSFRRGFDGWVYATHGFNNRSKVKGRDGNVVEMNSGNTYRMRPDGSRVEHYAWGPVNPFGMTIDQYGYVYIGDCHSKPVTAVLRHGQYQHFGNPHDGLGFAPDVMNHSHGSTAIAGCFQFADERFPEEFRNNFLVGNVMTSRLNRDKAEWRGSTPWMKESAPFLTCDDPWFRPVDMRLAQDGSIFIADFYNKIIGHYEVDLKHPGRDRERGRVWRVTHSAMGGERMADLTKFDVGQLIGALAHPNATMRFHALDQLSDRIGSAAIDPLKSAIAKTPLQRVHILWALYRLGALDGSMMLAAAKDGDAFVRAHAVRMLAETSPCTEENRAAIVAALADSDAHVRRAGADALVVHLHPSVIRPILAAQAKVPAEDSLLGYALKVALRNQLRGPGGFEGLAGLSAEEQRRVAEAAVAVSSEGAGRFLFAVAKADKGAARPEVLKHVARFGPAAEGDEVIALCRANGKDDVDLQLALFQAVQQGFQQRGAPLPQSAGDWASRVVGLCFEAKSSSRTKTTARLQGATDVVRAMKMESFQPQLLAVLSNPTVEVGPRVSAARGLLQFNAELHAAAVAKVIADGNAPVKLREELALPLGEQRAAGARKALLDIIPMAPRSLQVKLAAAAAATPEGAEALLDAVKGGRAAAALLQENVVRERLGAAKVTDLERRLADLTKGLQPLDAKVQKLIDERRAGFAAGDAAKGQAIYANNCAVCHTIENVGGKVGPQLDGIGNRGLEKLIEDVIDPNRNVDPNFYLSTFTLKDGTIIDGLVRREDEKSVVVVDALAKETVVEKGSLKTRKEHRRTMMPENFHETVSPADFNNLMTYLLTKTK